MLILIMEHFERVCKNAILFNPATSHYSNREDYVNGIIQCDMCKTENLKVCYGYENSDLCYKCYGKIYNYSLSEKTGMKITAFTTNYTPIFKDITVKPASTQSNNILFITKMRDRQFIPKKTTDYTTFVRDEHYDLKDELESNCTLMCDSQFDY